MTAGCTGTKRVEAAAVAETVESAWRLAFHAYRAVAVLISQRVVGTKNFE